VPIGRYGSRSRGSAVEVAVSGLDRWSAAEEDGGKEPATMTSLTWSLWNGHHPNDKGKVEGMEKETVCLWNRAVRMRTTIL
jgi:hypothetical protein